MSKNSDYVFCRDPDSRTGPKVRVTHEEFSRIGDCIQTVRRVCRVEELFHMVMTALGEFNAIIFRRADENRFSADSDLENDFFRIKVNLSLASFFTLVDTYKEYVCPYSVPGEFSIDKDLFKDERFRVCRALRNYIQHAGNFSITIKGLGRLCAKDERVSSIRVYADLEVALRDTQRLKEDTVNTLKDQVVICKDIDLYDVANNVIDVLTKVHQMVRQSKEYASAYETASEYLVGFEKKLTGFHWYWHETENGVHIASTPYFYNRQIALIAYLNNRYSCSAESKGHYITTASEDLMARMAEADKDIEDIRDRKGVIANCPNCKCDIVSSKYQKQFSLHK